MGKEKESVLEKNTPFSSRIANTAIVGDQSDIGRDVNSHYTEHLYQHVENQYIYPPRFSSPQTQTKIEKNRELHLKD